MKDKIKVKVSLSCNTCGGGDFDFNEDRSFVKCTTCNREYSGGYDELVKLNQTNIKKAVKGVGDSLIKDFEKSIKDMFKGNKHISIK